ncbi:MAG TPA: hypothetical protein VGX76_10050, partial [Pirellulales bacterium]|nr:hypothetical protein [Pirellulales bacterium]
MNKAFVKEPEDTGVANCPRCGSLGIAVGGETLSAQLAADDRRNLPDTAFFCPFARCDVVYFDQFERTVATGRLARPVFPKDPNAPICSCFDFTCDDIEADVLDGGVRRVKELLARSKSPDARCTTLSPSGQCCASDVQR